MSIEPPSSACGALTGPMAITSRPCASPQKDILASLRLKGPLSLNSFKDITHATLVSTCDTFSIPFTATGRRSNHRVTRADLIKGIMSALGETQSGPLSNTDDIVGLDVVEMMVDVEDGHVCVIAHNHCSCCVDDLVYVSNLV